MGEGVRVLIYFPTLNNLTNFLLGSGLKLIFHCCTQWFILAKSLLSSAAELSLLCTTENKEVSSANILLLDDNSSAKSFMYIKKIVVLVSNFVGLLR